MDWIPDIWVFRDTASVWFLIGFVVGCATTGVPFFAAFQMISPLHVYRFCSIFSRHSVWARKKMVSPSWINYFLCFIKEDIFPKAFPFIAKLGRLRVFFY